MCTWCRALATKGLQRIMPKGGMWGLFGWHTVPSLSADINTSSSATQREIILTEGEFDAMAVSQGLSSLPDSDPLKHVPAVSVPNGCNNLPPSLLPLLEPFQKIYLWLDNDKSGWEACDKFIAKLGPERCVVVRPTENDEVSCCVCCSRDHGWYCA
jgi:twinkle protein